MWFDGSDRKVPRMFSPGFSKVTHESIQVSAHTPREVGSHIASARGVIGGWGCLAQGHCLPVLRIKLTMDVNNRSERGALNILQYFCLSFIEFKLHGA